MTLALLLATPTAFAGVTVTAECADFGFSYSRYRFTVRTDRAVEAGAEMRLVSGYHGTGSVNSGPSEPDFSWFELSESEPLATAADGSSSVNLEVYYMATGGHLKDLDFAFKIKHPDGRIEWDNGTPGTEGYEDAHYRTTFMILQKLECWHLQNRRALPVKTVTR